MISSIQPQRDVREFESTYPLYDGAGIVRVVLRIADRLTRRQAPKGDEKLANAPEHLSAVGPTVDHTKQTSEETQFL
jgi:hypothetical protein